MEVSERGSSEGHPTDNHLATSPQNEIPPAYECSECEREPPPAYDCQGPLRRDSVTTSHMNSRRTTSAPNNPAKSSSTATYRIYDPDQKWDDRLINQLEVDSNSIYNSDIEDYDRKEKSPYKHRRRRAYSSLSDDDTDNAFARFVDASFHVRKMILTVFAILLALWAIYVFWYAPRRAEYLELEEAVTSGPAGDFTLHMDPAFSHLRLIQDLDSKHVPSPGKGSKKGRLVIIGDVHGMKKELLKLLRKINFDEQNDHLILTGDMIAKGPDSPGVVDLMMRLGASSVRGNHEDKVLLAHGNMGDRKVRLKAPEKNDEVLETEDSEKEPEVLYVEETHSRENKVAQLAKQFTPEQIAWLEQCPVILRVGEIQGMGEVVVVHAGLVPGLKLERQDPWFVMNMRTIDLETWIPSDGRDGTVWNRLWNHYQLSLPESKRSTVIYGHDSKRGLQKTKYSYGIDTGCLKGGRLTALVIEGGKKEVKHKLVSIKCKAYK